jgi:endonuclease/exonuclease/phosphatase family metal-dependent hydrolase
VAGVFGQLVGALDGVIPTKQLDRNLLVATWNIRGFGEKWRSGPDDSPKRDLFDVRCIAEVVSRFDVVAIQEARGNLTALRCMLEALGESWGLTATDVTRGRAGNNERMVFVFDTRRVKPSGLAGELVVALESETTVEATELDRQFARTPYAVSFQSGAREFTLVTLHILWGEAPADRVDEL